MTAPQTISWYRY